MRQLLWFSIITMFATAHGQWVPERENREYGIGIATTKSPYNVPLFFMERPSASSRRVAYFHNDTLVFFKTRDTVRSFSQMIETSYEEIGFSILGYSADSQWVKVTLDCHNRKNSQVGWLPVKTKDLSLRSWTEVFSKGGIFFFIKGEWRAFYSKPSLSNRIRPKLYARGSKPNYFVYKRAIKGRWMQVELETPTSFCRSNDEVLQEFGVLPRKRIVWIQFLDERSRPRIFYPTRGC
jgi:hypothetical protein